MDASELYQMGMERDKQGNYEEALAFFRLSESLRPHPVTALRIGQQLFALGRFAEIEYPSSHLWTDGWIRIGILVSTLDGDEAGLQGWLDCSDQVRNSKFIQAFLEVAKPTGKPRSQRARLIAPLVQAKDYRGLLRL